VLFGIVYLLFSNNFFTFCSFRIEKLLYLCYVFTLNGLIYMNNCIAHSNIKLLEMYPENKRTFVLLCELFNRMPKSLPPLGETLKNPSGNLPPLGETLKNPSGNLPPLGETLKNPSADFPPLGEALKNPSADFPPLGEPCQNGQIFIYTFVENHTYNNILN
jgi:hypothetical protein